MEDLVEFLEFEDYEDSGEGGLAVFFVILTHDGKRRQKCIAGEGAWPRHDVVIGPDRYQSLDDKMEGNFVPADLVMLIGSTTKSLWSEKQGQYFQADITRLTEQGQELYEMLTRIYGQKPDIVTLLDT